MTYTRPWIPDLAEATKSHQWPCLVCGEVLATSNDPLAAIHALTEATKSHHHPEAEIIGTYQRIALRRQTEQQGT